MRTVLATIIGLFVGFLLIATIEMCGHAIWPPPAGLDPADPESIKQYIDQIHVGNFILMALGHLIGALIGGLIGFYIAKSERIPGFIVVGLVFLATVINLLLIPHPIWFMALDLGSVVIAFLIYLRMARNSSTTHHFGTEF